MMYLSFGCIVGLGFSGYRTERLSVSEVTRWVSGTLRPRFRVLSMKKCFSCRVSVSVSPNCTALQRVSFEIASAASPSSIPDAIPEQGTHNSTPSLLMMSIKSCIYLADPASLVGLDKR